MKCEYGCGNDANFEIKFKNSSKMCCCEKYQQCSAIKLKNKKIDNRPTEEIFRDSYEIIKCVNFESLLYYDDDIIDSHCWIWKGNTDKDGYGKLSLGKQQWIFAHRFSYKIHIGPIEKGLCICHKCDTPGCVNPNHLFMTTSIQNIKDRHMKKRDASGQNNGMNTSPYSRQFGNQNNAKKWKLVDENGNYKIITNLQKYCNNNDINYANLYSTLYSKKLYCNLKLVKM